MEVIKIIASLPKWMILLPFRLCIAILNVFPCPWICVCSKEFFSQYNPLFARSEPAQYIVKSTQSIQLGHWLVAYIRGYCCLEVLSLIEEISVGQMGLEKDHQIKDTFIKWTINKDLLMEVIADCKILSR
jgi:hypothetical protein